jgi:hypothetical protein
LDQLTDLKKNKKWCKIVSFLQLVIIWQMREFPRLKCHQRPPPVPNPKLCGITDLENYANRVKAITCKMQRKKQYGSLRKSSLVFSLMTIINEAEDLRYVKIGREMDILAHCVGISFVGRELQTVRAGKTLRLQPTNLTYVEFV